ncbi:MAG: F0F1 ATP synthase subunit B [Chloroflexota bacterium]
MEILAVAAGPAGHAVGLAAAGEAGGLTINFFWVIVSALNFLVFLAIIWQFAFRPLSGMLESRRQRIEQGLRDAEQARRERDNAEQERIAVLVEARREANEILNRAQKVAEETREADIAATREELERMRQRAAAEIEAEKQRALADLRAEVADLALRAAGRVVGETMTGERQRRLVEEFLREAAVPGSRS